MRAVAAAPADELHRSLLDARRGTRPRPSRRRCARSTTWCATARCATSASRTPRRGSAPRPRCSPRFRGWAPLIALQIEYSLLERTVEGELVPMARELGLGVTPWSPLKSGVLSGKYTRDQHGKHEAGRGAWAPSVAQRQDLRPARRDGRASRRSWTPRSRGSPSRGCSRGRASLRPSSARGRWSSSRTTSRRLDVSLAPEHFAKLDALSKPKLNFPADFIVNGAPFVHGGTTINGRSAPPWPLSPKGDDDRY